MVFFEKSQPAPECLTEEKRKVSGNYRCGDVLPRLQKDFKNKCYICENKGLQTLNVEHFVPHEGVDNNLKFAWHNLFLACGHCNNTKSNAYRNLLDCTNENAHIEQKIIFKFSPFPYEKPQFTPVNTEAATIETCELLDAVYNGTTILKTIEAGNLRDSLLSEIVDFQSDLLNYLKFENLPDIQKEYENNLKLHLSKDSAFTAFKRKIIRENEKLRMLFESFFD